MSVSEDPVIKQDSKKYSFLLPATAGAFSGFITRLLTGPLDTLKIRNQLHWHHGQSVIELVRAVVREEGVLALWKGTIPGMYLWMNYSFVQFGVYDYLQQHQSPLKHRIDAVLPVSIVNGAVAGNIIIIFFSIFGSVFLIVFYTINSYNDWVFKTFVRFLICYASLDSDDCDVSFRPNAYAVCGAGQCTDTR